LGYTTSAWLGGEKAGLTPPITPFHSIPHQFLAKILFLYYIPQLKIESYTN